MVDCMHGGWWTACMVDGALHALFMVDRGKPVPQAWWMVGGNVVEMTREVQGRTLMMNT